MSHLANDKLNYQCELNIGNNNINDLVVNAVKEIKCKVNLTSNHNFLKNISQSVIIPAHFHLSYSENSGGIHMATPPGVLHVLCENGLFKYLLRNLYDSIEIFEGFQSYWREAVNRGIYSCKEFMRKYPSNLTQSENYKHAFDTNGYERGIRVLVLAAKR